jgi:hypothetical protein
MARARSGNPLVVALACAAMLLLAPAASAQTFTADPSIPDTTATSACTSPCALRQAIAAAQRAEETAGEPLANTVDLPAGTYTLTQGPLRVVHPFEGSSEQPTAIVGLGARANEVVITAAGKSRVLIDGENGGTSGQVELRRLEITGGDGEGGIPEKSSEPEPGEGGGIAIEQNGTLRLDEVLVHGNRAASAGGGIEDAGELVVENSTISDNYVSGGLGLGGGIASDNLNDGNHELLTVLNSTIVGNEVPEVGKDMGGAIFNGTTLNLTNSTLAGNAAGSGGGLASLEGSGVGASTLANDIIADNTGHDCAGKAPVDDGGNVVDDASCALGNPASHASTNPELYTINDIPSLTANGGPTATVAASSTSPAINAGVASACPTRDQRGAARPGPGVEHCDAGAVELYPRVTVTGAPMPSSGGAVTATSTSPTATCTGSKCVVDAGSDVTLTVAPNGGQRFLGWSDGSCSGTSNPCTIDDVEASETDDAAISVPLAVSLSPPTGAAVPVVQGDYGEQTYDAQDGQTVDLNGVINDAGVTATYTFTYSARFGGCNDSYDETGTLGPFTLPASSANQSVSVPFPLTGNDSFPGGAKISYGLSAVRADGATASSTGFPSSAGFEVGPLGISASNYNPYATESGSVVEATPTTAVLTATTYFADQEGRYEQFVDEPATGLTPEVKGSEAGLSFTGPADAIWLGFAPQSGLAFLGGANAAFPAPEYGVFQVGLDASYASPGYVVGPDDALSPCIVYTSGIEPVEQPQIVKDIATGLRPDTTYHYRFVQAFAEGICPYADQEQADCLDEHSGQPTWVPYLGSFAGNSEFPGSASPYAAAWNPIVSPERTFTTPAESQPPTTTVTTGTGVTTTTTAATAIAATAEPSNTTVNTSTGAGSTQIFCPPSKVGLGCTGKFGLYATSAHTAAAASKHRSGSPQPILLASARFTIPAGKTETIHFRLTPAGKHYLREHPRASVVEQVSDRIGQGPTVTSRHVVKLRVRR